MKKKTFEIPVENILEFAELVVENELANEITGTTDDDEIIFEVQYEPSEREAVFTLTEWYENTVLEEEEEED
jgi:hypothetical protein